MEARKVYGILVLLIAFSFFVSAQYFYTDRGIYLQDNITTERWVFASNLNGSLLWTHLMTYPTSCQLGQAVLGVGDTLTCVPNYNQTQAQQEFVTGVTTNDNYLLGGCTQGTCLLLVNETVINNSIDNRATTDTSAQDQNITLLWSNASNQDTRIISLEAVDTPTQPNIDGANVTSGTIAYARQGYPTCGAGQFLNSTGSALVCQQDGGSTGTASDVYTNITENKVLLSVITTEKVCGAGEYVNWTNGTNIACGAISGGAGGTVTSIATDDGSGIVGGTITATGTLYINNNIIPNWTATDLKYGLATEITTLFSNASNQDGRIISLESGVSNLWINATLQDARIVNMESNATLQSARIVALEGVDTNLWSNASNQQTHITNLWLNASGQTTHITNLWANATGQDALITTLFTNASLQSARIVALEGVDTNLWSNASAQQTHITNLWNNASSQEGHITNLWINATAQDSRIVSMETNASEQSGRLVYLDSNATLQDARIVALEGSLSDYVPLAGGTMTGDLLTTWLNVSVGVSLLDNDKTCYGSSCDVCEYFNGTHQIKEAPCGV